MVFVLMGLSRQCNPSFKPRCQGIRHHYQLTCRLTCSWLSH